MTARTAPWLAGAALLALTSGCGLKGDLYVEEKPRAPVEAGTPAGAGPTSTEIPAGERGANPPPAAGTNGAPSDEERAPGDTADQPSMRGPLTSPPPP